MPYSLAAVKTHNGNLKELRNALDNCAFDQFRLAQYLIAHGVEDWEWLRGEAEGKPGQSEQLNQKGV